MKRTFAVLTLLGCLLFAWLFWVEITRKDAENGKNVENYVERKQRHLAEELAKIEIYVQQIVETLKAMGQKGRSDEDG